MTNRHQILAHLRRVGGHAALELAGIDGQPCHALREVIVQFAREAPALVFVCGEQAAAQAQCLPLTLRRRAR